MSRLGCLVDVQTMLFEDVGWQVCSRRVLVSKCVV
jgi:hypothetical protein